MPTEYMTSQIINKKSSRRRIIVILLTLIAWVFLIFIAWNNRNSLAYLGENIHAGWLVVSVIALMSSNISTALMFSELILENGDKNLNRTQLVGGFLLSQAAKYIPGRIWSVALQRIVFGKNFILPKIAAVNIALMLIVIAGILGIGLSFWLFIFSPLGSMLVLVTTFIVLLVLATGSVKIAPMLQRKFLQSKSCNPQQEPLGDSTNFKLRMAPSTLGFMTFYSGGWFCLLSMAFGINTVESIRLAAALSIAQVLGQLSFLPAGIGAREVSLLVVGSWVGAEASLLAPIAISTRAVLLSLDLLSTPIGALLFFAKKRTAPP